MLKLCSTINNCCCFHLWRLFSFFQLTVHNLVWLDKIPCRTPPPITYVPVDVIHSVMKVCCAFWAVNCPCPPVLYYQVWPKVLKKIFGSCLTQFLVLQGKLQPGFQELMVKCQHTSLIFRLNASILHTDASYIWPLTFSTSQSPHRL